MATILRRITQALVVVTLAALTSVGLVGAPQMVIPAAVLGALGGIVAHVVALNPATPRSTELRPATRARAWRIGAVVALVALDISGMAVLLGDATGPLLLFAALAVTACSLPRVRPALAWFRARLRVAPPAPAPDRRPAATASPLRRAPLSTFGTAALCATWQRTYHHLGEVHDATARDALLELRRGCLDEFERRDPAGTARWLATEPRPAGTGPHRYVHPGRLLPPAPRARPPHGLSGEDPTTPQAPPVPPA